MMRYVVLIFVFLAALASPSLAQNCVGTPALITLTNGTNADATQVNNNFTSVLPAPATN